MDVATVKHGRFPQHASRALVKGVFDSLQWRRHGIGALQAYIQEGEERPEVRLHVWHPKLVREGIADHGDVHDHRFDMFSTVLSGTIYHEECEVVPHQEGEWQVNQVLHARVNPEGAMTAAFHEVVPGPLQTIFHFCGLKRHVWRFDTDETYEFRRGFFHRTVVRDLAVTLITKVNQVDARARVISRRGSPAIEAFNPADAKDTYLLAVMRDVLYEAKASL